eukprot:945889-Rhodomonas_salina.1
MEGRGGQLIEGFLRQSGPRGAPSTDVRGETQLRKLAAEHRGAAGSSGNGGGRCCSLALHCDWLPSPPPPRAGGSHLLALEAAAAEAPSSQHP